MSSYKLTSCNLPRERMLSDSLRDAGCLGFGLSRTCAWIHPPSIQLPRPNSGLNIVHSQHSQNLFAITRLDQLVPSLSSTSTRY